MIEVVQISKRYGNRDVLKELNLSIETGSLTAILGPNGAGKSTLFNILLGILPADCGQVSMPDGQTIGVVFQQSCLDNYLTVGENLLIRASQHKKEAEHRVEALLKDLDMLHLAHQLYGTLSGGQKRRVDIARALLSEPTILFLDEPTTGLDTQTRQAIWLWLQELRTRKGLTLVLTTHYLQEAETADQIYILDHGQVLASGRPEALKATYAKPRLILRAKAVNQVLAMVEKAGLRAERDGTSLCVEGGSLEQVISLLQMVQPYLQDFSYQSGSLDHVFMDLTGRKIRDDN